MKGIWEGVENFREDYGGVKEERLKGSKSEGRQKVVRR